MKYQCSVLFSLFTHSVALHFVNYKITVKINGTLYISYFNHSPVIVNNCLFLCII